MTLILADDVRAAIEAAVKRHPDRKNPTSGSGDDCVYTSSLDPDHHCIAGQVLVDLGFDVPDAGHPQNSDTDVDRIVDARRFDTKAIDLLLRAQIEFDLAGYSNRTWEQTLGTSSVRECLGLEVTR